MKDVFKKKKELKGHRTFNRLHQKEIFIKNYYKKWFNDAVQFITILGFIQAI